jgi:hypothetical protein
VGRIERALESPDVLEEQRRTLVADLSGGRKHGRHERSALQMAALARSFKRRRELLEGSLTASQVAELLGISRQRPHDRVKGATLLAVLDRGAWRFPPGSSTWKVRTAWSRGCRRCCGRSTLRRWRRQAGSCVPIRTCRYGSRSRR